MEITCNLENLNLDIQTKIDLTNKGIHKLLNANGLNKFDGIINGQKFTATVGDTAIWIPQKEYGYKFIFSKVDPKVIERIKTNSTVFPKIKRHAMTKLGDVPCYAIEMENVTSGSNKMGTCLDAFEELELMPEHAWYKKTNFIHGKIVDFHGFKILPERYRFKFNNSKLLDELYHNGPRSHTRKKDKKITDRDTLYQGFRFNCPDCCDYRMKGYTSDKKRYDSYRKLAFIPFDKANSVLDLGCNQGFFSFQACVHGAKEVVGVEYDKKHLDFAKKLDQNVFHNNIKWIYSGAPEFLQGNEKKYDLILLLSVLHQIYPNLKGADPFMKQVAKSCKYFSFETPVRHPKMECDEKKITPFLKKYFKIVRHIYTYNAYSPGSRAIFCCYD